MKAKFDGILCLIVPQSCEAISFQQERNTACFNILHLSIRNILVPCRVAASNTAILLYSTSL